MSAMLLMNFSAFWRVIFIVVAGTVRWAARTSTPRRKSALRVIDTRLWRGVDRLDENASSNGNHGAVKLICGSIRT
jgi:hypothetical protein